MKRALLCLVLLASCVVPEVKQEQLVAARLYGTPEETFTSLQLAFQVEVEAWEYECLSYGFKNDFCSTLEDYSAYRASFLEANPFMRWALVKAELESVEYNTPIWASCTIKVRGWRFLVGMRREYSEKSWYWGGAKHVELVYEWKISSVAVTN